MRRELVLLFLIVVCFACCCVSPFKGEKPQNKNVVPTATPKSDLAKKFNSQITQALKSVFGDAKLIESFEDDGFIHLSYKLPRETKPEDLNKLIKILGYSIEDTIYNGSDVLLTTNLNGKTYEVHILLLNDTVDIDIESKS